MKEDNRERKECGGCRFHNPECRQGSCVLNPHSNRKSVSDKKEHDTS